MATTSSSAGSRCVQLFSRRPSGTTGSRGSGFLLGDGLVLTARHVLVPIAEWGELPANLDLIARPIGETEFQPATLVWPPTTAELADQSIDVALVQLTNVPEYLRADETQLGFGSNEDGEDLYPFQVDVFAVGFPEFMKIDPSKGQPASRGERFDTYQMNGYVAPFTGEASGSLAIDWSKQKTSGDPARGPLERLDWKGFSGSGLRTRNRRLIGVVITVNQDDRFDFRGVRIDPLLSRPDFLEALKGKAAITGAAAMTEAPLIKDLIYLLDREPQESDLIRAHRRACPPVDGSEGAPPARPLLCLVPGAAEFKHLPEELLARFSRETLPSRFNWPRVSARRLRWPSPQDSADAMTDIRETLWEALSQTGNAPEQAQPYREIWQDMGQPRMFYSDLTQYPLNSTTATVLGEWAAFWSQLAPVDRRPPMHLLLLGAKSVSEADEWRAQTAGNAASLVTTFTEFMMCTPLQLKNWFDEHVQVRLPVVHAGFVRRVRSQLEERFQELFFLQDLQTEVKHLADGGFHV